MLIVHRSNRAENLVAELGDTLALKPPGPFEPETVIVQGRGMERWLSMKLAERFGVWAQPDFPFPRRFLLRLFERNLQDDPRALVRFEPEALSWAIAARLPDLLERKEFVPLLSYLREDDDPARLLALADKIARTFDDYVVFRARLIESWEDGADDGWEGVLWRRLVEDLGRNHVAARARALLALLDGNASDDFDLPDRISLFGVSTLAPLYLEIFHQLARRCDVHLYVLSPSREYWADIRGKRQALVEALRAPAMTDGDLDALLEREVGNRLLASLGRIGREFQAILEASGDYQESETYSDPRLGGEDNALCVIQSDMLDLRYRSADSEDRVPYRLDDDSITVHSCHGPMREVQVLHDQLRAMFDADSSLRPRDVIVMTPDIDTYAPFIEAVFDSGEGHLSIPFRIADRGPSATSEVFDAFGEVLRILPTRMPSSSVVDLLRRRVVRDRFGFAESDIEVVREWVDRTEIRWGMDAKHRAEYGHLEVDQNTWDFGLRRLFLGYAVGGEGESESSGYAPYGDVDGGDAAILGRLADYTDRLFSSARRLSGLRRVDEWRANLSVLLDDLLRAGREEDFQVQELREALAAIDARAVAAAFDQPIGIASVAKLVEEEIRLNTLARGFLTGALTFCELVPMRTIPFRVVCLVGMNDGAFPRIDRRPDFDRIGQHRRWGDRSLRDDDRYMFLEAILSAREKLYISFVGQDAQANSQLAPSVVVQELLDAMSDTFLDFDSDRQVIRHPMQAFSPQYFAKEKSGDGAGQNVVPALDQQPLVSYSRTAYEGALALVGARAERRPFFDREIDWTPVEVVSVYDFVRFFENPSRAFLQRQLGLYLGRDLETLDSREPLDVDDLERWKIGDAMLRRLSEGEDCDFASMARGGTLPVGSIGEALYEEVLVVAQRIASGVGREVAAESVEVDFDFADIRVAGVAGELASGERRVLQYSQVGGRQELSLWLRHLLLCAARPEGECVSRLYGRLGSRDGAVVWFERVPEPMPILAAFVDLYVAGMRQPLPLFSKASRDYASTFLKSGAIEARRKAEQGYENDRGDSQDDYVRKLFGDSAPFEGADGIDRFAEVALAVYRDFLSQRVEVKL